MLTAILNVLKIVCNVVNTLQTFRSDPYVDYVVTKSDRHDPKTRKRHHFSVRVVDGQES